MRRRGLLSSQVTGYCVGLTGRETLFGKRLCALRQRSTVRPQSSVQCTLSAPQHVSRVLANLLVAVSVLVQPAVSLDLETAREIGEAKRAEQESRLPPRVRLPSGVVYRELRPGDGLVLHWDEQPDVVFSWAVLRPTDLYYQFGSWNRVSLEDDLFRALPAGEATLVCGLAHGLKGAREHALRRIWVPASLGYVRGDEVPQPRPDDFGAQRRFTRLRQRNADLVFEVEVRRVRPNGGSKLHVCPLGSEQ